MTKLNTIVFDGTEFPKAITIEHESYEDLAKTIGCEIIDIIGISLDGKDYDLVINDLGTYESDTVTAFWGGHNGEVYQQILGTCMLVKTDGDGETIGLDESDLIHVINHIAVMHFADGSEGYGLAYNVGIKPPTKEELLKSIFGDDSENVDVIEL